MLWVLCQKPFHLAFIFWASSQKPSYSNLHRFDAFSIAPPSDIFTDIFTAEDGNLVPIKKEDLTRFIEFELEIRDLEKSQCEERLGTSEVQLSSLQAALKNAETNLSALRQNT